MPCFHNPLLFCSKQSLRFPPSAELFHKSFFWEKSSQVTQKPSDDFVFFVFIWYKKGFQQGKNVFVPRPSRPRSFEHHHPCVLSVQRSFSVLIRSFNLWLFDSVVLKHSKTSWGFLRRPQESLSILENKMENTIKMLINKPFKDTSKISPELNFIFLLFLFWYILG